MYLIKKEWLLALFFVGSICAQSTEQMLKKAFENPESSFNSNIEQSIFIHFQKRCNFLAVSEITGQSIVFRHKTDTTRYTLKVELSGDKINRFYRDIRLSGIDALSGMEVLNLKVWIGSFLYRIDSGLLSAAEDMVFQDDIRLLYTGSAEKAEIIKAL